MLLFCISWLHSFTILNTNELVCYFYTFLYIVYIFIAFGCQVIKRHTDLCYTVTSTYINVTTTKATNKVSLAVFYKSDVSNWTEDLWTSQESRLNNFISTILISQLLNVSSLEKHVCVYVCICTVQMNSCM